MLSFLALFALDLLVAVDVLPLEGVRHELGDLDVLVLAQVVRLPAEGLECP